MHQLMQRLGPPLFEKKVSLSHRVRSTRDSATSQIYLGILKQTNTYISKCHDTNAYCDRTILLGNLRATRKTTWRLQIAGSRDGQAGRRREYIVVDRQCVALQSPGKVDSWYIHHVMRTLGQSHRSRSTNAYVQLRS
jgi:hypothetical protein